jgi:hypothetical protein
MKKANIKKTKVEKAREQKKRINTIIAAYVDIFKEKGKVILADLDEYGFTRDMITYYFGGIKKLKEQAEKAKPKEFFKIEKIKKNKIKKKEVKSQKIAEICKAYAEITGKYGYASMQNLIDIGYTKDTISYYFGSLSNLNIKAREKYPDAFFDISIDDIIVNPENDKKLSNALSNKNRFIVTTAVTGCRADYDAIAAMEKYCEDNDAHVLVLSASDPAHNKFAPGTDYGTIDSALFNSEYFSIVPRDIQLNSNIGISTIKLSAKHTDPATGMKRIAAKNGSFIFASPKQRLAPIAMSNADFPYFVMTTGAITMADYSSTNYMSDRTAVMACHDHIMGGLIIEIEDDRIYHFRQFQINDKDSSFIDLGIRYNADKSTNKEKAEAFVLGDWHSGSTDPTAKKSWLDICNQIGVKKLIMHDMFDGISINHHERQNVISRAKKALKNEHNLESEMKIFVKDIDELCTYVDKLVIVKSNHDEFLNRYLASGYYIQDPENHRYSLDLAIAMMDGKDPIQHAVSNIGLKYKDKVQWLQRDDDFTIQDIQLGAHGDLGPNGARGSLRAIEAAYSRSVTGHAHSPEILRGAWQVGTSTYLKLAYNRGPSSWLHSSCLVYSDGSRQMINSIDGKWKL